MGYLKHATTIDIDLINILLGILKEDTICHI